MVFLLCMFCFAGSFVAGWLIRANWTTVRKTLEDVIGWIKVQIQ